MEGSIRIFDMLLTLNIIIITASIFGLLIARNKDKFKWFNSFFKTLLILTILASIYFLTRIYAINKMHKKEQKELLELAKNNSNYTLNLSDTIVFLEKIKIKLPENGLFLRENNFYVYRKEAGFDNLWFTFYSDTRIVDLEKHLSELEEHWKSEYGLTITYLDVRFPFLNKFEQQAQLIAKFEYPMRTKDEYVVKYLFNHEDMTYMLDLSSHNLELFEDDIFKIINSI